MMIKENKKSEWDPGSALTDDAVVQRIKTFISYRGWQHAVRLIDELGIPIEKLHVAEIGCGNGTFALTLALMGASVVLVDDNEHVLAETRRIYEMFDCTATFIKTDCLNEPPQGIAGSFDLVASGGLVEHFEGSERRKCISFHRSLLKKGGFAYIGVPNRFNLFYRSIMLFRKMTGTWTISHEEPFSYRELISLAKKTGYRDYHVLGSASLAKDMAVYSRGFASAVLEVLPDSIRGFINKIKFSVKAERQNQIHTTPGEMIIQNLKEIRSSGSRNNNASLMDYFTNKFSSGLILFGHK